MRGLISQKISIFEKNGTMKSKVVLSCLSTIKISAKLKKVGFLLLFPLLLINAFFAFRALPVIFFRRNFGDLFFDQMKIVNKKKLITFTLLVRFLAKIYFKGRLHRVDVHVPDVKPGANG